MTTAVRVAENLVAERTGIELGGGLRERLAAHLDEAASARGQTPARFAAGLAGDPGAFQQLLDRVTVQETGFFRHPDQFAALAREVLPALDGPVVVWSAGCANGQEAYSLAMELAASELLDWQVVATDISATAVARARAGRYSSTELAGLPATHRHWLRPSGNLWEVDPDPVAEGRVEQANLTDRFPVGPGRSQVVFCRNVLIYLSRTAADSFLDRLANWLAPGGLVFLGYEEPGAPPAGQRSPLVAGVLPGARPLLLLDVGALAACHREQPDVALLDVEMPHLDGHGVLAQIKADPRLADIPVVFVTSRVTTEDVVDGLRLGAHDYLRKPFEPSELLARVHAAVRNKALQDELRLRNAELELASRTDALTGLRNRRHLEEQLQRLAATGDPLSVLLCDIDRFKQVNDTCGHAAGDQVLRVVATRLGEVARPGDVPGRWGGEEFLVLLPGTGPAEAAAVGERTRLAIAAAPVPLAEGPLTVTTSVGVATGADDGWECLVRRADTGLYAAKESGRDRVAAGPPPEPAAGSRTFTPEGQDAARYR